MLARLGQVLFCTAFVISTATPSLGVSANDIPQAIKRAMKCMVSVLNTIPHVEDVKVGIIHDDNWAQSFVQYQYQGKGRNEGTVRFVELRPNALDNGAAFHTRLGGLFGGTESGPPDLGTREITHKWKARCGVNADVLYM